VTFAKVWGMPPRPVVSTLCHVLREDPELAEAIPGPRRTGAIETCVAPEVLVPAGSRPGQGLLPPPGGIGLLILEGLVIRRVGIEGKFGAEVLGEGDLLRPWQYDGNGTLPLTTDWTVLAPMRLAALDEAFVGRLAEYPELAPAFVARAMQRARNLAVNMAIVHQPRVDVRLHMLLWHLAARWGRVRSDGTALPLRLTHAVLSELVAARRPTVTSALSELARKGLVRSTGDSWLLFGEAPGELLDVDAILSPRTARHLASGS
jgi:CRP/FNR family transcriptional regulator, cyclic AMP receptor protein